MAWQRKGKDYEPRQIILKSFELIHNQRGITFHGAVQFYFYIDLKLAPPMVLKSLYILLIALCAYVKTVT